MKSSSVFFGLTLKFRYRLVNFPVQTKSNPVEGLKFLHDQF
jgi:hypothetical protein